MNNQDFYAKRLLKYQSVGYDEKNREVFSCHKNPSDCVNCAFRDVENTGATCQERYRYWCNQEYHTSDIDPTTLQVDDLVLVREDKYSDWLVRYFAKYEDGILSCWIDGRSSKTTKRKGRFRHQQWREFAKYDGR